MTETLDTLLGQMGLSLDRVGQASLVMPVLLFLVVVLVYFFTAHRRKREMARARIASSLVSGARRRNSGLTQEEILARLRPETEEQDNVHRTMMQVSEGLLKIVNFDKAKTQESLIRAGQRDPKALSRYIIQRGMGMIIGPVLLFLLLPSLGLTGIIQIAGSLVGVLAGGILVDVRLDKAVSERKTKINTELPVLLDLLTIYLEAGSSFDVSLARASNALKISFPVAAAEILYLRRDLEMSIDREKTLRLFANRIGTQTAKTFVAIVVQSEKRGNAIAPALRRLAQDARREVMADIEKKAQKIPTVMQLPMFVFILPAIFASVIGPAVLQVIQEVSK
jgi:tight adherence protein C